jgi:hypothetical protein
VSCYLLYSVVVPACSTYDLKVVLKNPGPCTCRGESCACPKAASRVILPAPTSGHRSHTDSRVYLTEEFGLHSGWHGSVPSAQAPTVSGMASQCLGWRHSAGDGRTGSEVTEGTCSSHLASWHRPRRALGWWPYAPRGRCCPFLRGAEWRRDGSRWHSTKE